MLSKITLKNMGSALKACMLFLSLFTLLAGTLTAQTTITTPYTPTSGNGIITFNFTNGNAGPVLVTGIGSIINLSGQERANVTAYFKASAIAGAPGAITAANGWNSFGTATVAANGLGTVQPLLTCTSLLIPAGATYGIAVNIFGEGTTLGALAYNNNSGGGSNTVTAGGCTFTTGTGIGYAGAGAPTAPTTTVRRFIGTITFANVAACTGAPVPGNTVSTVNTICSGTNFVLSLANCLSASGITYQWQKSAALAGPYTDIAAAINSTLTTSQTAATYYRSVVTCSGNSSTSTPLLINLTPTSLCYCAAGSTDTDPAYEKIQNVKFGTINNTSFSFAGYQNFTGLTPTASFEAGSVNTLIITGNANTYSEDQVVVWIDYNRDGDFTDPGETVYTSTLSAGPYSSVITIPNTASVGTTVMRIRLLDDLFGNGNNTSCGNNIYGQVEDYLINITPCIPVNVSAQPVSSTISCGADAVFSLTATGTALTYQWQQRNNATSAWNNLSNGGVYAGVNTNSLSITGAPVSMNGYQYRVVYTGGCSGTDFSNVATLTVNTLLAVINPPSAIICNGSLQKLTISNINAPALIQFSSGAINLAIPDKIGPPISTPAVADAGVNHTIPVTIPAGSVIASMNVTLNINHTWIGDLVVVLKAPNGKILNLLYHKSGTGATSGGTNLTNTVISSTGTAAISTGTAPFTGTFKADASIGAGSYGDTPGSGPTGFSPDVTTFSGLYSTPSGNWTIAVADPNGWDGDKGTLVSWSLEFAYGAPSTGVFSGTAGTLFTDAAGTVLYTGTPVNSLYVKPTVTANYSVVVTNPVCVSSITTIPITVNNPITGTATSANKSVCIAGNTSFTATPVTLTGNTIFHQWKVSTDAGVTYSNVSNGGVYSGATTATLNITGATASMNGYRYKDSLYVNVCNSFVNTNASTLTVNPTPVVTLTANPLSAIYPGQTTTLSVAVSPNPAATYTWFRNGVVVPGATASTLVVDVDAAGIYKVDVTDVNGCSGTSLTKEIKSAANDILFIYPSPNRGQFQVRYFSEFGNSIYPRFVNVYDSKGSRVFTKSYSINNPYTRLDVDIKNYGKGIYQVELTDFDGKRIKTGRVLVL